VGFENPPGGWERMMLKHASGWRRGQIILVMSILLITVILMVSTIIYLTSTQHLFFNYNPSREIILSIDADFERALTRILANATAYYNRTITEGGVYLFEIDATRRIANMTFSHWVLSTQAAYSGKGLNIRTEWIDEQVQGERAIPIRVDQTVREEAYMKRRLENRLFKLFWYRPNSISAIGADISIDATAQGIVGWKARHIILLNLTITSVWKEGQKAVYVNVIVLREDGKPVNDLRKDNFEIYLFDPTTPLGGYWWKRTIPEGITVTYNGGGNYTFRIEPQFYNPRDAKTGSFWSFYYQFVIVRVKDNRGIIVEAYSYSGIEYVIQERAVEPYYPNNPSKMKETYVFELLPNGSMYWYGTKLSSSSSVPPIPFPPVKQLIVNVTKNGYSDPNFEEVPYQIEAWDNRYLWPVSEEFLNYTRRFMNGSKLVFEVKYPPGVSRQRVRIMWREDCDFRPIPYNIEMKIEETEEGKIGKVEGTHYSLWVVVKRRTGEYVHVDWSISLWDKSGTWHVEYILPAYDAFRKDNTYYIPMKFPNPEWTVLPKPVEDNGVLVSKAPVRLVLYNKSDLVITTPPAPYQQILDELHHEQILYIPYDVSYFLYFVNATWKKNVKIDYSYLMFMGMIGGLPSDQYVQDTVEKFKWGSLLTSSGIVNGTFNNRNSYIPHRGYALGTQVGSGDYSYWSAIYNENQGACIFASQQLLDLLDAYGKTYKKGNRETNQLFVWTRSLGASRFMEYDAIAVESSTSTTINVQKTPNVEFKAAGFIIGGGIAGNKFNDDIMWYDGDPRAHAYASPFRSVNDPGGTSLNAVEESMMYYRMFLDDYAPIIVEVKLAY
jgi:hypothetical protein